MQSQLFRKKSLERISSPEQLQDYMRVTSPGIWLMLAAVMVLLAGLIVSSAVSTLESCIDARAVVAEEGDSLVMGLPMAQKGQVEPGMAVRVAGQKAHVTMVYQQKNAFQVVAELDDDGEALPAGTYDAQIVTQTITPISFLINSTEAED